MSQSLKTSIESQPCDGSCFDRSRKCTVDGKRSVRTGCSRIGRAYWPNSFPGKADSFPLVCRTLAENNHHKTEELNVFTPSSFSGARRLSLPAVDIFRLNMVVLRSGQLTTTWLKQCFGTQSNDQRAVQQLFRGTWGHSCDFWPIDKVTPSKATKTNCRIPENLVD